MYNCMKKLFTPTIKSVYTPFRSPIQVSYARYTKANNLQKSLVSSHCELYCNLEGKKKLSVEKISVYRMLLLVTITACLYI